FVYPFVSDSAPVRQLTLESSAGTVEATLTGGGQVVGINLDSSLQDQVLTLRCDRVDSPEDLGLGSDIRPLCLKLISVRLEP
ncbi:MAG: YbaB/EbfC family nucleoid-associated protein, partial [Candidatus Nanopelagicales bacterium]